MTFSDPRAASGLAPSRKRRDRSRAALAWGLGLFLLGQLAFVITISRWRPALRDPEYGHKLSLLRARLAEHPDRPLVLALGSSRTGMAFRPDALPPLRLPDGRTPLVFNFSLTGSGPIMELVCLRRLLAEGIRPGGIILEVFSPLLHQEGTRKEECWLNVNRLAWRDVRVWRRYLGDRRLLYRQWIETLLTPWFTHRFCVLSKYAPAWLAWSSRQDVWRTLDPLGWMAYPRPVVDAAEYARHLNVAFQSYAPSLTRFHVTEAPDRALRELLALCRAERIPVLLALMPEGSEFRSWYPPWARPQIDGYLARLQQEYGVAAVDAHAWIGDGHFVDSHHLLPAGAAAFSERFGREALPLLLSRMRE